MFNSINRSKTVKKILASLFVTSVAICSASVANAQTNAATSVHSGNVPSACTVTAINGTLSSTSAVTSSIDSTGSLGRFTAICNSTHSFRVELLPGTRPSIPAAANYVERFRLTSTATGYTGITTTNNNTSNFIVGPITTLSLPPTSSGGYDVDVAAQASVDSGFTLPSGGSGANSYIINVRATVTP
jgi:hypothetical protein